MVVELINCLVLTNKVTVYLDVKEGHPKVITFSFFYYRSSSDATKLYKLAISLSDKALTKVSNVPMKHVSLENGWETYHIFNWCSLPL